MATHSGLRLRKLPRRLHINFQESSSVRRLYFFVSLWACLCSVPGPAEPNLITELIIGLNLGFLLIFLLIGSLLYIIFLKEHPPSVKMVGSGELKNLEETQLQCLISHFRPKPLKVFLFLKSEPQNKMQEIAYWSTTSAEKRIEDDENVFLIGSPEFIFKVYPELKSKPKNYYDCQWKICIKPNIQKLKKFELLLAVKHKGFPHGLCTKRKSFKIIGNRPVLSEIKTTTDHQNILLEISISQFAPQDIQVRWYHGLRQISENINPKNIEIREDHLCYFVSKVHLDPKTLGSLKTIRCEVKHSTSVEEKTLNETDISELLEEIQHYPHKSLPLDTPSKELYSHLG